MVILLRGRMVPGPARPGSVEALKRLHGSCKWAAAVVNPPLEFANLHSSEVEKKLKASSVPRLRIVTLMAAAQAKTTMPAQCAMLMGL